MPTRRVSIDAPAGVFREVGTRAHLIEYALLFPALFDRGVAGLGRHEGMAHTVIGLAGGFVPARVGAQPVFLARMVL